MTIFEEGHLFEIPIDELSYNYDDETIIQRAIKDCDSVEIWALDEVVISVDGEAYNCGIVENDQLMWTQLMEAEPVEGVVHIEVFERIQR